MKNNFWLFTLVTFGSLFVSHLAGYGTALGLSLIIHGTELVYILFAPLFSVLLMVTLKLLFFKTVPIKVLPISYIINLVIIVPLTFFYSKSVRNSELLPDLTFGVSAIVIGLALLLSTIFASFYQDYADKRNKN